MHQDGISTLLEFATASHVAISPQQQLLLRTPLDAIDIGMSPSVEQRLKVLLSQLLDLPADDVGVLSSAVADASEGDTVAGRLLRDLLGLDQRDAWDDAGAPLVEVVEVVVESGDLASAGEVDDGGVAAADTTVGVGAEPAANGCGQASAAAGLPLAAPRSHVDDGTVGENHEVSGSDEEAQPFGLGDVVGEEGDVGVEGDQRDVLASEAASNGHLSDMPHPDPNERIGT